ncbi:hypothetical protein F4553_007114 [Allocatelliglobosispora scoriae]|uniref:Uncharacterized protein n=1 Tax=Allocatelliglobosispora scoriae TaxID=643052 RepID=A0A841C3Y9_9ACTN|nr:hypothetical protein [Allocatelliglobosispora scoriae]MBB5873680.1 hypothetical protein [Allocatelliglobosispora scoriae]
MPESIDGGTRMVPRRVILRGTGALVPAVILASATGGAAAAASPSAADRTSGDRTVRGAFSAGGYGWPAAEPRARAAAGVTFTLTAGGLPLADRRVRFSLSEFHAAGRSLWFEAAPGPKPARRLGYLDLDTDASGTVLLDRWLRLGAVPTAAIGAHPLLRAQLVGSETLLASARLSVL